MLYPLSYVGVRKTRCRCPPAIDYQEAGDRSLYRVMPGLCRGAVTATSRLFSREADAGRKASLAYLTKRGVPFSGYGTMRVSKSRGTTTSGNTARASSRSSRQL